MNKQEILDLFKTLNSVTILIYGENIKDIKFKDLKQLNIKSTLLNLIIKESQEQKKGN